MTEPEFDGPFHEPWTVDADGEIWTDYDNLIVDPTGSTVPIEDEARYMRRIAACVNACAGMSTELLQRVGPGGLQSIADQAAQQILRLAPARAKDGAR